MDLEPEFVEIAREKLPNGTFTVGDILLARADGERQQGVVGEQFAGRVGLFLRADDFDATYQRLADAGAEFVTAPRVEPYGRIVVFRDIEGNR